MYTLGIDIGSTTTKCVLLRDGSELAATSLTRGGLGTGGAEEAFSAVLRSGGIDASMIAYRVATGYGRKRWEGADGEISELSAHALGCNYILPGARTVIDIGGQDAKVISLDTEGRMSGFTMNDKCAAGTGRFLDVMANILNIGVEELGGLAGEAAAPAKISSTCTVFAESEVISQLAAGAAVPDVAAGVCNSVAARTCALARRQGVREKVYMSGGVARNEGVRRAIERELGVPVATSPLAQLAGALGAALYAYKKAAKL